MTRRACHKETVNLHGHTHEEGCGHKMVKHGDHYDFVNDDGELHHLVEDPCCCDYHEGGNEPVFVSHGLFDAIFKYVLNSALLL